LKDFIKNAMWNPAKDNKQVHTFVNRMKADGKRIPKAGCRFNYIVVKKYPFTYDITGKQTPISIGDKMEYPDVVESENLEIDLLYYFGNELTGQFARLIIYDKMYEVYKGDKVDDDATMNACRKAIKAFADQHSKEYKNVGHIYKKLYKSINEKVSAGKKIPRQMKYITNYSAETYAEFIYQIKQDIELTTTNDRANKIISKCKNINAMYKLYSNKKYVQSYYTINMNMLISKLNSKIEQLYELMNKKKIFEQFINFKDNNIRNIINHIKSEHKFDEKCIEKNATILQLDEIISNDTITEITNKDELYITIEKSDMDSVFNMMIEIMATYKMIVLEKRIRELLSIKKNKASGIIEKPKNFTY
jgi:hypothetical protein